MYFVLAGIAAIVLKFLALGPFADLSWWWVLSPFALAVAWWAWADGTGYTKRKETELEAERIATRRQRHLEDMGLAQHDKKAKARR